MQSGSGVRVQCVQWMCIGRQSCRSECMFTMLRKPAASATELLSFLRGRRRMLGTRRGTASHPSARAKTSLAGFLSGPSAAPWGGGQQKRLRASLMQHASSSSRSRRPVGFRRRDGDWKIRNGSEAGGKGTYGLVVDVDELKSMLQKSQTRTTAVFWR
jgi:hypothetical protein